MCSKIGNAEWKAPIAQVRKELTGNKKYVTMAKKIGSDAVVQLVIKKSFQAETRKIMAMIRVKNVFGTVVPKN